MPHSSRVTLGPLATSLRPLSYPTLVGGHLQVRPGTPLFHSASSLLPCMRPSLMSCSCTNASLSWVQSRLPGALSLL